MAAQPGGTFPLLISLPFVLLLVAAGAAGQVAAPAAPPADAFATCEKRFADDPQAEFACGCFYTLGSRQAENTARAMGRLAEHLAADPENPCLLFTLGRLERLWRRGDAGAARLAAAAAGYARRGHHEGETYARINLTDLASQSGDEAAAEAQLDLAATAATAAAAANPEKKGYLPVEVELRRGKLWLRRGEDLAKVETLLRELERALPGAHDSLQREIFESLGDVLHQLGRHDEAEATFRRMIEVTRRATWNGQSDRYGESAARHNLALARLARPPSPANVAVAISRFEEALAAAEAGGHRVVEAEALRLLGRLEKGAEGRRRIERSIALARELADPFLLRMGLAALAAEIAASEPARAAALAAEAERVELDPLARDLPVYGWFDRLAASWLLLDREAAIAHAMRELAAIEAQRERQRDSLARAETFSVWAEAYSWLAGHLLEAGELDRAFDLLERRHARVLLESSGAPAAGGEEFASLAEAREALAEDQALLYFQQAYERDNFGDFAGGSWLLAVTRGGVKVYRTADPIEVDPLLPSFTAALAASRGEREGEAAAAARLGEGLLGPALAELPAGVRRLLVVPDEDLQLLPFGALRTAAEGRRLAESYEIAVLPSATLWRRWLRRPAERPSAVLALADPDNAAAPHPLPALPGARREGRAVRRSLGGASGLWLGEAAGEAALAAEDLSRYGLLHFAAHAVHGLPGSRAERSALVLAGSGGSDGLLRPGEIRGLALAGKAVVLSSCRGADGEVLAGEGPLSLAQAFFAAGAELVVASLWNIGDNAAARFHQDFYDHLARGEKAGHAFAAAQKARIAAGDPPAAWAGLVLLGNPDWRIAPVPPRPTWWIWASLAAVVLFALAKAKMRARRPRTR